jgi:hypothetical protein
MLMVRAKAYIALNPSVTNRIIGNEERIIFGRDYEIVDLLSFEEALRHMKRGYGCARMGFTQRGPKWVSVNPGNPDVLSHLELVYHPSYPGAFAAKSVPWAPSRCDLFEDDWFIHPLAPFPQHRAFYS